MSQYPGPGLTAEGLGGTIPTPPPSAQPPPEFTEATSPLSMLLARMWLFCHQKSDPQKCSHPFLMTLLQLCKVPKSRPSIWPGQGLMLVFGDNPRAIERLEDGSLQVVTEKGATLVVDQAGGGVERTVARGTGEPG